MSLTSNNNSLSFGGEKNLWQLREIHGEQWFVSETAESIGLKFQIKVQEAGMYGELLKAFAHFLISKSRVEVSNEIF